MPSVFVSSVITDYEPYREAAREAITLMGYQPVMAEYFAPRDYSPESACLTEVSQADIYLLLLGSRYGFETAQGLSVTQAEFRQAIKTRRPMLALVEQTEMLGPQKTFRDEVQHYTAGLYRGTYSWPSQAKDEIVRALRQMENRFGAASEAEFDERLRQTTNTAGYGRSPFAQQSACLTCSWWPQPTLDLDLREVENKLDAYFDTLCDAGLATKRDGYKLLTGKDHTGLRAGTNDVTFYEDGLIRICSVPTAQDGNHMSMAFSFVPPSRVKQIAIAGSRLFAETGAWCQVRLDGLDGKNFAELPYDTRGGVSIPMHGDHNACHNQALIPYTAARFEHMLDRALGRFERIFSHRL